MADAHLPPLATLLDLPGPSPDPMTDKILDAALAEFTEYGLRRAAVDDIRRRAGVNRATVYRRFATKNDLVAATLQRWILRLLTETAAAVADRTTVRERLIEGFVRSVLIVRTDALVGRLLTSEPESFLPYLTTDGAPILQACREFLAAQCRELQAAGQAPGVDADAAAEIALRLAQSVVLTPEGYFDLSDEATLRAFAGRCLGPLVEPIG
ncbi:TetR/AcrR family transcriptional regulator [Nocardia sp. NPDC050710]|uniref:TetR/AcrR family transcriptional regulator n=1 Tax=Nocardia sp. NPDC050710 TaxID=3157220 RepID=UPI0034054388